jgi:hypothetical protein
LTDKPATSDLAVIAAKRLDSDEVEEMAFEVDVPAGELGQRTQLADLVHARYPEAEFRSFADEAASFLAHKVLIVAFYRRSGEGGRAAPPPEDDSRQQQLFAA